MVVGRQVLYWRMHRWRVLIVGNPSGRPVGSVMARDQASARKKALDIYEIEPVLLRVVPVEPGSAKAKPRDLVTRRRRRVSFAR